MTAQRRILALALLTVLHTAAHALDDVPKPEYRTRRSALADKMKGGIALLFAADEPILDFRAYRQDPDFFYLTGWNEPGAALMVIAAAPAVPATDIAPATAARPYREILFLPLRNLRTEKYTGLKMDAATLNVAIATGVDEVRPLAEMPAVLTGMIGPQRTRIGTLWTDQDSKPTAALLGFLAASVGTPQPRPTLDLASLTTELRALKSPAELALLKKAADASVAAQFAEMHAVRPNVTERKVAGVITAALLDAGCERVAYAPIVGSGANATTLHYSENAATMHTGDLVVIDAAGEYSMYASDITRTLPVGGKFTPRQREIYDIVLGAQRAAVAAFVAGKSKLNDPTHKEPDSLDTVAFNYINAHGHDLHGQPLGQYMVHGIGHLIGIDVHDPWDYTKPLDKNMAFTIEPGLYLPEERIGVRIEDTVYADADGHLVNLTAKLPHKAAEIEAAMKR